MDVRDKIQMRLDRLEAQLKAGEHLRSAEGVIAVLTTIKSVSKFWSVLTDEERDFLHLARDMISDGQKEDCAFTADGREITTAPP